MSSSSRTPSRSPAPAISTALPPMPPEEPQDAPESSTPRTPRRTSFSFLRRGKSIERIDSQRSTSSRGKKLTKRQLKEQGKDVPRENIPMEAPRIPNFDSPEALETFGGDGARPDSYSMVATSATSSGYRAQSRGHGRYGSSSQGRGGPHPVPVPPLPQPGSGSPHPRSESMANRGRYSYASSATSAINNPRRVRRRKDPTPFNVLIVGVQNSGKTAFADFLRTSLTLPARKQRLVRDDFAPVPGPSKFNPSFVAQYLETDLGDGERIGLTLWDSEGLEQNIIDVQLRRVSAFIESKFEETFNEEIKISRSPGARDTHIHCVFLVLDPSRLDKTMLSERLAAAGANGSHGGPSVQPQSSDLHGKSEDLDIQVLRALQRKTTVVPVISKADTVTVDHMALLKHAVWTSLKRSNLDHLTALGLDESSSVASESESEENIGTGNDSSSSIAIPISVTKPRINIQAAPDSGLPPSSTAATPGGDDRSMHSRLDLTSSSESSLSKAPTPRDQQSPSSSALPPITVTKASKGKQRRQEEDDATQQEPPPSFPLSIISPSPIIPHEPGIGRVGRRFPWGFADPYDPEHCDFVKLRDTVFGEWRSELRQASREIWYEQWRTTRLHMHKSRGASPQPGAAEAGNSTGSRSPAVKAAPLGQIASRSGHGYGGTIGESGMPKATQGAVAAASPLMASQGQAYTQGQAQQQKQSPANRRKVSIPVAMGGPGVDRTSENWPLPSGP